MKRSYLYKTDIFVRILRTMLVVGIQVFLLNILFGKNELYVGWSKSEAYLVIGIWNLLNYLGWSIFSTNLLYLESKVVEVSLTTYFLNQFHLIGMHHSQISLLQTL